MGSGEAGLQVDGLHQVALRVADLDRAVGFYTEVVGLRLLGRFPPGLAFLDLGGTRLLLEPNAAASMLYLRVADVRAAHAQLVAGGVVFESDPHMIFRDDDGTFGPAGEEEWMAFFRDSEDNLVAVAGRHRPGA